MQFSESWLRSFCNPSMTTDELAHALTMAGLEVEEVTPAAPPFTHVVVGEILTREKHPNADKLALCTVNVGALSPEPLQVPAPKVTKTRGALRSKLHQRDLS